MKMEVQIISKEILKPSSSSSSINSHPKIFKNSILDQAISARYAPLVLYYPMNKHNNFDQYPDVSTRLNLLKTSLSETLACFYPLAGTIRDNVSIDCNDEGARFVETRVNCTLEEFLTKPDLLSINKFLPCDITSAESIVGTFVTNVQVNVFECGGIVLGICMSHRIVDGDGLRMFLKAWSTKSERCESNFAVPASGFPASDGDDLWLSNFLRSMAENSLRKSNFRTKRFVFYAPAIAKLKDEAIESGVISCPSRVEVVSAILWKSMAAALAESNGSRRPSLITHMVNIRRRMEPSVSENRFGNFLWIASAKHDDVTAEPGFGDLASKIREATGRIDNEFVEKIKGGQESKSIIMKSLEIGCENVGVDTFVFSSWCNFRYYDVADFGWGKPIWVSCLGVSTSFYFNLVMLVDTYCGGGVEAWITLDEQHLTILERNKDIIRFASLDPSPLLNAI